MARRPARYPRIQFMLVPPDPRRKSNHLVILTQESRYAPLLMFCAANCSERGRTQPDGSCRHTDLVKASMRPYWQRRARPDVRKREKAG